MDQRTGALAEEVTQTKAHEERLVEKLETLEHRLTEAAENVARTYSRMLTETTDGVARMAGETATALNPLHQTRAHPGVMLGGDRVRGIRHRTDADPRSRMGKGRAVNYYWLSDTETEYPMEVECR